MDGGLEPITFWDIHLVFDRRLPEREAAGDTAPASAASAFETAIAGVPSTNIPPPPRFSSACVHAKSVSYRNGPAEPEPATAVYDIWNDRVELLREWHGDSVFQSMVSSAR